MKDHPVSPFGPATPPKEGNWKLSALRAVPLFSTLRDHPVRMKLSALRAVLFGKFPSLGGVAAEPPGWFFVRVCGKGTDHPVRPFGPATPPKEGN